MLGLLWGRDIKPSITPIYYQYIFQKLVYNRCFYLKEIFIKYMNNLVQYFVFFSAIFLCSVKRNKKQMTFEETLQNSFSKTVTVKILFVAFKY